MSMTEAVAEPIERIEVEVPLGLRILVIEVGGISGQQAWDMQRGVQEALAVASARRETAVLVIRPDTKLRWLEATGGTPDRGFAGLPESQQARTPGT